MRRRLAFVVAALCARVPVVSAQPAPAPDKSDAQVLVASGMKMFSAKDYRGALAAFRDAYARFPSTKILLDIATTLAHLDLGADAANTYQRYLDASDADPAKRTAVAKELGDLDRKLAILTVTTAPADAEVQIAGGDWLPATATAHYRVAPGEVTILARRDGYTQASKTIHVDQGGELAVTVALAAKPVAVVAPPPPPPQQQPPPPPAARSRVAGLALVHVAVEHPGAAALVGVEVDALPWLEVQAAALVGETSGGYAAAAFEPWPGRYRPFAIVGAPVFVSHGARVALRGGVGVELVVTPQIALVAELAIEYALNPEADIESTTLVPALGVTGRL
jgi:hypothetical protein